MIASIVTIGDELLIGQTIDTNSAYIAKQLNSLGIDIYTIITVSDKKQEIIDGISNAAQVSDLVIMTGGLGPTKDDITKYALAEYFYDELKFSDKHYQRLVRAFEKRSIPLRDVHKNQFYLPSKANLMSNDLGTAPGMLFEEGGKMYFSMPGVPYEMKHLLKDRLLPLLQKSNVLTEIYHRTLLTIGIGETTVAEKIEDLIENLTKEISIAYLPSIGLVKVRISAKGENLSAAKEKVDMLFTQMQERLSEYYFGEGDLKLEKHIGSLLKSKGLTLALAESCTGGNLGHTITSVPGSSAYFEGSVVSYSYELKKSLLNVSEETLNNHGAVSEETVIEMQQGAARLMNSDLSISVSGIAGPGGGTEDKPVGTIWMACGNKDRYITHLLKAGKNRAINIEYATVTALNLLRQFINDVY